MNAHVSHVLRAAGFTVALALGGGAASAGPVWDEIKGSVYGDKKIEDGRGLVSLEAPNRPDDMGRVPISIDAAFKDGRTVKTVTFVIDENPTPVVAVFHMGGQRGHVSLKSEFRVNAQSDVRAVVEASDGKLYMVSQLVKFAGGQASCSAPPAGDPAEIAANMGKMSFVPLAAEGAATSMHMSGRIRLSHPNHTGMVMDQITLLYTPIKMISEITVKQGDEPVFTAEGSIALSQDPMIEFDMMRSVSAGELEVTMKDTDGGSWTKKFPLGPAS
ncbi:MAG TPA: quinoprotein dehydrogenase-associated SoxYZ-like carrier [Hyphomicrobium sp.]|nr:quinoprotein dehydrogenase-associated SoxYZ-like carrier [Hyphomicrobium sp.]